MARDTVGDKFSRARTLFSAFSRLSLCHFFSFGKIAALAVSESILMVGIWHFSGEIATF